MKENIRARGAQRALGGRTLGAGAMKPSLPAIVLMEIMRSPASKPSLVQG